MVIDILLIVLASILILTGLIGCVLPVIPGPPISYLGILTLHFTSFASFTLTTHLLLAGLAVVVTIIDYIVPVWGTKKAGGSKWGIWGATIGLIVGLLFGGTLGNFIIPILAPVVGIILGPFLGALTGEILYNNKYNHDKSDSDNFNRALKSAFGSFLGFMLGIFLKLIVSSFIAFVFVKELIVSMF